MAIRYIALSPELFADWQSRFDNELRGCDWLISAEWANIDDDDEARKVVAPLASASSTRDGDDVVVDFGESGLLRVYAIDRERCAAIRKEQGAEQRAGPGDDCEHGLVFSIEGAPSLTESVLAEAVQAMAIGMAGAKGFILTATGLWFDIARGRWIR